MQEFLLQTYTIILPIALGYIVWLLQQQKKDKNANERGTMLLLRVQLIEYHTKYMRLGEIPSYAYQNFEEMYEAYHDLGGNGMVKKCTKRSKSYTSRVEEVNKMDISSMTTVIAIVVICYLIGLAAKTIPAVKDNYIPVIVGAFGGILGVLGMYVIPDFPAQDILNAIAVGIVSGLSSTGVNQVYKQLKDGTDQ